MLEPVVDGVSRDAQMLGGEFDADFAVLNRDGAWSPDLVGVSHPCDAAGGERLAFAGGQRRLGVGESGKLGLPACFQSPCYQTVFRLDVAEGALRAVGLIASPLHGQLGSAVCAGVPVGDLIGGGQRQPRSAAR